MKSPIQIKNNQIVISKPFAKNAYCFGTQEYQMLQTVRHDYPNLPVVLREIKKNTTADHYNGLTYEYMKWYIGKYEKEENKKIMLTALEEMIEISKCHSKSKRYPTIKAWFLEQYPAVKDFGMPKKDTEEEEAKEDSNVVPFDPATDEKKSA